MKFSSGVLLACVAALSSLSGCGGGSSTAASSTLSGKAAVGFPIVAADVQVVCAGGGALSKVHTDALGAWTISISGQTLPCAVEVTNGTINGSPNPTAYHSVASSAGTVNVTPLTDLLVANLSGVAPSTWFASVNATSLGLVSSGALSSALLKIRTALTALTALGSIDPITQPFTASSGNAIDDMLSAMRSALAAAGLQYSDLLAAATASSINLPTGLGAALATSYATTTTGANSTTGSTTGGTTGCTGAVASFFAANAKTYTAKISTYNGTPNATPTVLGYANGTTAPVTVNSNCTITLGTYTLTAVDGTFFNANNQVDVDMSGTGFRFGHFEKFADGTSLLGLQDPASTDAAQFSLP
jgi:hypothetical protein